MEIKNLKIYGLEESIARSGYPMRTGLPPDHESLDLLEGDMSRASKLGHAPIGSGHNNFLIGIVVQFDLRYTQYWTKHLQRYHWFQYFSGQSIMHKLTSNKDVLSSCNKWTLRDSADTLDILIKAFNNNVFPFTLRQYCGEEVVILSKEDCFHYIVSNCPMGYQLWQPITTNYMQLKTMYHQRKTHKLEEWKEFCAWIETLPESHLITEVKK